MTTPLEVEDVYVAYSSNDILWGLHTHDEWGDYKQCTIDDTDNNDDCLKRELYNNRSYKKNLYDMTTSHLGL